MLGVLFLRELEKAASARCALRNTSWGHVLMEVTGIIHIRKRKQPKIFELHQHRADMKDPMSIELQPLLADRD